MKNSTKKTTAEKIFHRHHENIANVLTMMGDFVTFPDGSAFLIRDGQIEFGRYNADAYLLSSCEGQFLGRDGELTYDPHAAMVFDNLLSATEAKKGQDLCPTWETVFVRAIKK